MPMRIAHCILEPRYSGAEILVLGLVRAQLAAGVATAVIGLRPSEELFESELDALAELGCEIFIPSKPLVRQERLFWIRRATRAFRPQVLFAHSALPSVYGRLALMGIGGVSFVTVLHTDEDFENAKLRAFENLMWRRNAIVVGVSPASLRNYRRLITEKKETRLIANGVNLENIRAATVRRHEVRERVYQAAPDEIILLQVGRVSPQKQQRLSVEALAALGRIISIEKVRLVFAGLVDAENYYKEVEATARALGVASKVEFLGSRNDVPLLLAGADAHLMPSAWEAQGIVALEALASGIFCIFTRLDAFLSFEEMPGVDILPKEPSSTQLGELLATAFRTSAITRRYLRDMGRYDIDRCAREYLDLANSLQRSTGQN
jgi:glycosyltransferase involved in cell wall biosynthesis